MADLIKALKNESIKQRKEHKKYDAVIQTQLLLADKTQEDLSMLREMGLHTNTHKLIDIKGEALELSKLDEKYGQVYTEDEIKAICIKYALRFRKSEDYKGHVDIQLTAKIREFAKSIDKTIPELNLGFNMFIMAPYHAFNLEDAPPKPRPRDPIAFYKVAEGKYRLIHQWGKDLSIFRQLIGWKYANGINYILFYAYFLIAFIFSLVALFGPTPGVWDIIGFGAMSIVISLGWAMFRIPDKGSTRGLRFSNDTWNSKVKNYI